MDVLLKQEHGDSSCLNMVNENSYGISQKTANPRSRLDLMEMSPEKKEMKKISLKYQIPDHCASVQI